MNHKPRVHNKQIQQTTGPLLICDVGTILTIMSDDDGGASGTLQQCRPSQ